ncbi:hypothetical protein DFS33DRAFT_1374198 [Desarmillaria ectypa]|nr:hypothetical protein DFS33DRAFT_1374198 [Desarmillaria ectypa]
MLSPPPFGYCIPTVCFFNEKEELDVSGITFHILRVAKGGVSSIIVQDTNGKAQHLYHERKQTTRLTREMLDANSFKNLAGCGTQSARETQKLCVDAKDAGADYALILSPSTFLLRMSVLNVIRFHHEVADASPIPTMIIQFPRPDFALPGLLADSSGRITAASNLMLKLHDKGEEAMKLQATTAHADWALQKSGGIGGVKKAVSKAYGYGTGKVRTPLREVTDESLLGNQHYETLMDLIRMEERLDSKL